VNLRGGPTAPSPVAKECVTVVVAEEDHNRMGTVCTFTKEIFSLTVLLAVSVDADNHAVMIA